MAGPRRRAFLLGCESDGLEHCEADARRLAEVLGQRGFDQVRCLATTELMKWCRSADCAPGGPPPRSPARLVQAALDQFLDQGSPGESLLIYFSGHGHDAQGAFNLVVGTSRNERGHVLDIVPLVDQLSRHLNAAKRLLILDCCDAGGAASRVEWNTACGDRLRIWVAARTHQHAQELDGDTEGGLFTAWMLRALGDRAPSLAVKGCIRVNALSARAREELGRYRSPSGDGAPIPTLYGADADDIVLAEKLPSIGPQPGWAPSLLASLRQALSDLGVGDGQAADSYRYCRERADSNILPSLPRPVRLARLLAVLADPDRYQFVGNRLKLPLLTFVAHIDAALGHPDALSGWLSEARQWLLDGRTIAEDAIDEALAIIALPSQSEPRPYLMLRVAPDLNSDGYSLAWVYIDEYGVPADDRPDPEPGLAAPHALIDAIVAAARRLPAGASREPQIEVILPFALLADDAFIDALERAVYRGARGSDAGATGADGQPVIPQRLANGHLAAEFPLVLRCWERWFETLLVDDRGGTKAARRWREHHERCLPELPKTPCLAWLRPEAGQSLEDVAQAHLDPLPSKHAALALAHDGAIAIEDLGALLELGAPIMLWPRCGKLSPAQLNALKQQFKQEPARALGELPRALHAHRCSEIGRRRPESRGLSLLWDTPEPRVLDQPNLDPSTLDPDAK